MHRMEHVELRTLMESVTRRHIYGGGGADKGGSLYRMGVCFLSGQQLIGLSRALKNFPSWLGIPRVLLKG